MKKQTFTVVGSSHRLEEVEQLGTINPEYEMTRTDFLEKFGEGKTAYKYNFPTLSASLIPEPDNPADPDAIKVVADGHHVGYIHRAETTAVKVYMDSGYIESIQLIIKSGPFKYSERGADGELHLHKKKGYYDIQLKILFREDLPAEYMEAARECFDKKRAEDLEDNESRTITYVGKTPAPAASGCLTLLLVPALIIVAIILL